MKYIKLFEHSYTIYQLATMPMWKASELLIDQCKKHNPDMDLLRDLFEYAVLDVNQQNEVGETALMWASYGGHTEIVKMLLERPEIDVNLKDEEWDRTALMLASLNGRTEIVRMLLERPEIRVNMQDHIKWTALIFASYKGHKEIANLIKAHPNFKETL